MNGTKYSLEDEVAAVLERACAEQDFAVAEHLLNALELLAQRGTLTEEVLERCRQRTSRGGH